MFLRVFWFYISLLQYSVLLKYAALHYLFYPPFIPLNMLVGCTVLLFPSDSELGVSSCQASVFILLPLLQTNSLTWFSFLISAVYLVKVADEHRSRQQQSRDNNYHLPVPLSPTVFQTHISAFRQKGFLQHESSKETGQKNNLPIVPEKKN